MKNKTVPDLLICPYCQTKLIFYYQDKNKLWGKVKCGCDEFPIVNGIIYFLRDDYLTNRQIVEKINSGKYLQSLRQILSDLPQKPKILVLGLYMLQNYLKITIPQNTALKLFELLSENKSWFKYLENRIRHKNIELAAKLYKYNDLSVVTDCGYGIGTFFEKIVSNGIKVPNHYFGIDKSFFSLLISSIYYNHKSLHLLCLDADCGLPFRNKVLDSVFFIDSFWHIKNKKRIIGEFSKTMKENSQINIVNMYTTNKNSMYWGYGISPQLLSNWLKDYFKNVYFIKDPKSGNTKATKLIKVIRIKPEYSLYASR